MRVLIFFLCILNSGSVLPCSVFNIPTSKEKVFAKSYDWHVSFGLAILNKKHVNKKQLLLGKDHENMKPLEWTSKYGSIGFAQHGREIPIGGMNEAGLMVEALMLRSSEHLSEFHQPTLNELQWVQYQLDMASSTQEAIALAKSITVKKRVAPLHYMVCDKTGECGVFEYVGKELVIHTGKDLEVTGVSNSTYDESIDAFNRFKSGKKRLPTSTKSLHRFIRLADHLSQYDISQDPVKYAKKALEKVNQKIGTKWQIIYQPNSQKILFKHRKSKHPAIVEMSDFDFSCKTPVKIARLFKNYKKEQQKLEFKNYSKGMNKILVNAANLSLGMQLTKKEVSQIISFPETTECMD